MAVAKDLTQDVFLRLPDTDRHQPDVQGGRAPSPLLLRIARNLMIDQWRRERVLPKITMRPADLDLIAGPTSLTEQRSYDRQRLLCPNEPAVPLNCTASQRAPPPMVSTELGVSTSRDWTLIHDAYRRIRLTLNES